MFSLFPTASLVARAPYRPQSVDSRQYHPPGESTPEVRAGDLVLTHGSDNAFSRLIRFGQSLRFRGDDRTFAYWNHAAMVVSDDGHLVEALATGIRRTHLSRYQRAPYVVVHTYGTGAQRGAAADYLEWTADLGVHYGWLTIVSIALSLLVGGRLAVGLDGSEICSTSAAEALKALGYRFNRRNVMPADLARYFLTPGFTADGAVPLLTKAAT